jgi:hypothetical protein
MMIKEIIAEQKDERATPAKIRVSDEVLPVT